MKKVRKAVFGFGRSADAALNTGCAGLACAEDSFQGEGK
jgi:hypothetical protein